MKYCSILVLILFDKVLSGVGAVEMVEEGYDLRLD